MIFLFLFIEDYVSTSVVLCIIFTWFFPFFTSPWTLKLATDPNKLVSCTNYTFTIKLAEVISNIVHLGSIDLFLLQDIFIRLWVTQSNSKSAQLLSLPMTPGLYVVNSLSVFRFKRERSTPRSMTFLVTTYSRSHMSPHQTSQHSPAHERVGQRGAGEVSCQKTRHKSSQWFGAPWQDHMLGIWRHPESLHGAFYVWIKDGRRKNNNSAIVPNLKCHYFIVRWV